VAGYRLQHYNIAEVAYDYFDIRTKGDYGSKNKNPFCDFFLSPSPLLYSQQLLKLGREVLAFFEDYCVVVCT
jgi:hypothetical protein